MRYAKTRLKGHDLIWWREIQLERGIRGKDKITKWDKMVEKMKRQFISMDYEIDFLKNMQGLKQATKTMK